MTFYWRKGADLLRMKIFSERYDFSIDVFSLVYDPISDQT